MICDLWKIVYTSLWVSTHNTLFYHLRRRLKKVQNYFGTYNWDWLDHKEWIGLVLCCFMTSGKRWTQIIFLYMFKNIFGVQRVSVFSDDCVTFYLTFQNDGEMTTNAY